MFTALDRVSVNVGDLESAAARYAALLGCEPASRTKQENGERVAFRLDNMALELISIDHRGLEEGIAGLTFATPDIVKARHALERRGIPSTTPIAEVSKGIGADADIAAQWSTLSKEATFGTDIAIVERSLNGSTMPRSEPTTASGGIFGLDHVVVMTSHPERAAALYGARLGLDMKLDRTNPDWGSRLMFFRCGDLIVEIAHSLKDVDSALPDKAWGLSWRVADVASAHARLREQGFTVSDIRPGRKPGTRVFTVRDAPANVPTLVLARE